MTARECKREYKRGRKKETSGNYYGRRRLEKENNAQHVKRKARMTEPSTCAARMIDPEATEA